MAVAESLAESGGGFTVAPCTLVKRCNITYSNYTLNFEEGEISPCNSLIVTVTPYNGYYRNISGIQNTAIVHLNQG